MGLHDEGAGESKRYQGMCRFQTYELTPCAISTLAIGPSPFECFGQLVDLAYTRVFWPPHVIEL